MNIKNIGVFISGGGSNFKAIVDNIDSINGRVKLCVSNNPQAKGLNHARENGIKIFVSEDYKKIMDLLEEYQIDLIVLAGYLKIVPPILIEKYKNKIINIHPSLIPAFSGMGFYGKKVHKAAIDKGVKISGATTHFVNEIADDGPIIIQRPVEVDYKDTIDSLAAKVLKIEHEIIVESVRLFCNDQLEIIDNKVVIK